MTKALQKVTKERDEMKDALKEFRNHFERCQSESEQKMGLLAHKNEELVGKLKEFKIMEDQWRRDVADLKESLHSERERNTGEDAQQNAELRKLRQEKAEAQEFFKQFKIDCMKKAEEKIQSAMEVSISHRKLEEEVEVFKKSIGAQKILNDKVNL